MTGENRRHRFRPVSIVFHTAHDDLEPGQTIRLTGIPAERSTLLIDPSSVVVENNEGADD